jgi:hypothetical protein
VESISFWAAVCLPLFDIPLIMHIVRRKSSVDISVVWAVGLWASSVLMAPSAFVSGDKTAIGFNVVNVIMLSIVLIAVLKYRTKGA